MAGKADVGAVDRTAPVAFSAAYTFSFEELIMVGHLDLGSLRVKTCDHFTDGSGRSDYYSRCYMWE
jgi:hypothetical protein